LISAIFVSGSLHRDAEHQTHGVAGDEKAAP
jgi:hypothetical protein